MSSMQHAGRRWTKLSAAVLKVAALIPLPCSAKQHLPWVTHFIVVVTLPKH